MCKRGTERNVLFATTSRLALGSTNYLTQWVLGHLSLEEKQLECEADNSVPPSVQKKHYTKAVNNVKGLHIGERHY
jgi:hypothetical protein